MQSRFAIAAAIPALRPGVRRGGWRLAGGLRGALLNPFTHAASWAAVTNTDRLYRLWARLEQHLGPVRLEEHLMGSA